MDKMYKLRSSVNKTFYPDDPDLSTRDKELVDRTYHMFKVIRKLLKTFADNSKCKRQLYIHKIEPRIDECFANAKCASSMYTEMGFIYEQIVHDIRFNNIRDDYIIAMNKL